MDSPTLNIVPAILICLVHLDNVRNLSNALFKSAFFLAYHSLGYTRFFFFLINETWSADHLFSRLSAAPGDLAPLFRDSERVTQESGPLEAAPAHSAASAPRTLWIHFLFLQDCSSLLSRRMQGVSGYAHLPVLNS